MKKFMFFSLLLFSLMGHSQTGWVRQISTATTGQTITIQDTQQDVIVFHNSNTLALSISLNFPANPRDGQFVIFCSKSGITALSLVTNVGQILGMLTTISITSPGCWVWFSDLQMWVRIR